MVHSASIEPDDPKSDDEEYCFDCEESPCECVNNMLWVMREERKRRERRERNQHPIMKPGGMSDLTIPEYDQ